MRHPRYPHAGVHSAGGAVSAVVVQRVVGAVDEYRTTAADGAHLIDETLGGACVCAPRKIPAGAARGRIWGRAVTQSEPLVCPKVR